MRWRCFNSRTPCGVRPDGGDSPCDGGEFQFTHPVWGATPSLRRPPHICRFQFTHPVWGATPVLSAITARGEFQFTHPVWGATQKHDKSKAKGDVSIHAPRVGCDSITHISLTSTLGFNSRTPCGVRPHIFPLSVIKKLFQFTHPVWGATYALEISLSTLAVSIHAPRVGCDSSPR